LVPIRATAVDRCCDSHFCRNFSELFERRIRVALHGVRATEIIVHNDMVDAAHAVAPGFDG
jgi:hypothetical protein